MNYNHAIHLDEKTKEQFEEASNQDFVLKAALMPDAHLGYVAPIGSVFLTKDYVVPAWVGYDIGCGMTAVRIKTNILSDVKKNSKQIYKEVMEWIPMGKGKLIHPKRVTEKTKKEFKKLLEKFKSGPHDKEVYKFIKNKSLSHLGTLGSGNHFLEICENKKETWIVVHSGSRGVGYKVAQKYMKKVAKKEKGYEATFPIKINSKLGKEYLNVLDFGLEFALLNRKEMIYKTILALEKVLEKKLKYEIWVNKNHNHAVPSGKNYIHRKGATPAKKNERGVIPANMRDGSFLVEGLGNPKFLHSSSHGAGRLLSRTMAKKNISMSQFKESMKGIVGTIDEGTIDEAPAAYKNISEVMDAQKDSVKIIKHLKPIINMKGSSFRGREEKHS
ncbi:MAG: RtcB family protein [Candidatus Nanoarchaeia archaeon]|nr:RtcB family protein [Candidatus Nanoarchaeia archaeon]